MTRVAELDDLPRANKSKPSVEPTHSLPMRTDVEETTGGKKNADKAWHASGPQKQVSLSFAQQRMNQKMKTRRRAILIVRFGGERMGTGRNPNRRCTSPSMLRATLLLRGARRWPCAHRERRPKK